ncbi:class I SAM-dependent methyltransferase [Propionivibrio dicarboxylicus]|uniref:Methyltransferase domain-containing protein n=1 Tax=Propionivibrio dicarboxylicus TaxID=83767 RepID=A0A1G8DX77_9RHOO|nr:class I SAM-dependent methyltransferase [Propionivibrio dicarboxylicus]SDH62029.1 Methyltransferase domain-containing protein [Propionivibrio dicarboxylicus]
MKSTCQREVFLASEADAWFERNHEVVATRDKASDPLYQVLQEVIPPLLGENTSLSVLEIGCGEGKRLEWIAAEYGVKVAGIDPSAKAVAAARARSIDAVCGTAEQLPWPTASFDIVIFGFCLYLCDPEDLFRIAAEADRVLKAPAWLLIHDFHSSSFVRRPYHHKPGILSTKMDFRRLFDWHPAYTCYAHRIGAHGLPEFTDDKQEWVAISLLRKNLIDR